MILASHAIAGAAVASLNPSKPFSGFFTGFILHFILDAIPHWDYKIKSGSIDPYVGSAFVFNRDFFVDVLKIAGDGILGIVLSLVLFYSPESAPAVLVGAFGGILPDALQFAYGRLHWRPLALLQDFHFWIHATHKLQDRPILGIAIQAFVVGVIVLAAK